MRVRVVVVVYERRRGPPEVVSARPKMNGTKNESSASFAAG